MELKDGYSITDKRLDLSAYTIYMIDVLNSIYIGSTNDFRRRIYHHISDCHNKNGHAYNTPLYKHIRELEEKSEFKFNENCFQIIEEIKDCDEETAKENEKAWIEFYKDLSFEMLNKRRPVRTGEEMKEQNRAKNKKCEQSEKRKAYKKAYNQAYKQNPENRERVNQLRRENYAKKKAQKQTQK